MTDIDAFMGCMHELEYGAAQARCNTRLSSSEPLVVIIGPDTYERLRDDLNAAASIRPILSAQISVQEWLRRRGLIVEVVSYTLMGVIQWVDVLHIGQFEDRPYMIMRPQNDSWIQGLK